MGWIVLGVVVLLLLWLVVVYNRLVSLRQTTGQAWSDVDVQLKLRHDLVPNLVETVKGYAAHERGTLEAVVQARNAAAGAAGPAAQAQAEGQLGAALGRLLALSEAYPDLKANQNFMALQTELGATEDRIASARRYYNANVRELNTKVETLPTNVIAGIAKVSKAEYFETEGAERQAPQVSFGADSGPSAPAAPYQQPAPSPQDSPAPTAYQGPPQA